MSATSCSLLPHVDMLDKPFGEAVYDIARRYFSPEKPVYIQTTDSFACSYVSFDKVHHEQTMFKLLNEEFQLITIGCTYTDNLRYPEKTNGSAILMLPKVPINTQISVSNSLVKKMEITFGAAINRIVLVSSYISTTHKEQKQVALELLNRLWKYMYEADIIVLLPEVGWSYESQHKFPDVNVFAWFIEKQRSRCLRKITDVTLVDRWISQEKQFQNKSNLFALKKVTSLYGCVLNLSYATFEPYVIIETRGVTGVLPQILIEIGSKIDATFRFQDFDFNKADIMLPTWLLDNRSIPDDCTTATYN